MLKNTVKSKDANDQGGQADAERQVARNRRQQQK